MPGRWRSISRLIPCAARVRPVTRAGVTSCASGPPCWKPPGLSPPPTVRCHMPRKRNPRMPKGVGEYQTADGPRYYFRYERPTAPGAKRDQPFRRGFATPEEAETAMWEERIALRRGTFVEPSRELTRHYLSRWLKTTDKGRAPSTSLNYRYAMDRMSEHLGDYPLGKVTPLHVQEAVNALLKEYAANTVIHDFGRLKQAMRQAVKWKLIPENPCEGVTLPKATYKKVETWSAAQMQAFLDARASARDPRLTIWHVFLGTGARIGEVLALRWSDVDLAEGSVSITRTVTRRQGPTKKVETYIKDSTKTEAGRREVPIEDDVVAALRRHRTAQREVYLKRGKRWDDSVLVFQNRRGTILNVGDVGEALKEAIAASSLPQLTPHGLRSTHATVAIEEGADVKTVSQRLGHSTVVMTLNRYVHPSKAASRNVAKLVKSAMESSKKDVV
ncbi:MAG: site-specific integrase [Desulfurellales bacterium]|nr:MAG: site-specific integrase [Desulfurellales bacterium]